MARACLRAAGLLAAGLGFVGVFLPLVPTTPFLLLAAWCFVRSSPGLHAWLLSNRWFGPYLRQWEATHTVPRRAKTTAIAVVLVTFGVSMLVVPEVWQRWMLLGLGCIVLVVTVRLPTR
ncbi:MAG: YbaN family protein [Planctomycetota bacterium]